jgi:uncharacterized UPF0160 family protein
MTTIATHNGSFHADDVFGVAVLMEIERRRHCVHAGPVELVRTRDPEVIAKADYAVDVGGIWEPATGRFDHHQKGFDGRRQSGVLYASAGQVWATHGAAFVRGMSTEHPAVTEAEAVSVAQAIDDDLVQYLDMADTGAASSAPGFYGLSMLLSSFNLTSAEEREGRANGATTVEQAKFNRFKLACETLTTLLLNIARDKLDKLRSADLVRNAERLDNGQILVLRDSGMPWFDVVCNEMPDVLFVVYPDSADQQYQLRTVPVTPDSFKARKDLPRAWAGLRNEELATVTGVADAVFCHNSVFIGGAKSLEGTLQMARLALAHVSV